MQYFSLYVHIWSITGVYVFMKASYACFALIPHPLSVLGHHTQAPERARTLCPSLICGAKLLATSPPRAFVYGGWGARGRGLPG